MVDFQKKDWQFRDLITEDELNRMEDGIEEGITKAEQAQQTADDAATAAANAQSDIDDYKNEISSLGIGIDVNPRTTENLDLEVQPGWVSTTPETIGIPSTGGYGVVRIDRRAENRVVQTYYHLSGLLTVSMQMRTLGSGGTWTDWVRVLHSGNTTNIVNQDYEVGTWTPEYTTTGNPFANITISDGANGTYIRIGRLVFIRFGVATHYLEKGNASGELRIAGLPFPNGETASIRYMGLTITSVQRLGVSPIENYYGWRMAVVPNSTEIVIFQNDPNSDFSTAGPEILQEHITSSYNVLRGSGVYYTS